jgi:anti-sigma B factor antagonist
MEIKLKKHRKIYLIILSGELDLYNAPKLERAFSSLKAKGAEFLIIDFDEVDYIDSSGVGILIKLKSLSASGKIVFMLSGIKGEVLNVLKLTNLIKFFPISPTLQSGIKKLLGDTEKLPDGASIDDQQQH